MAEKNKAGSGILGVLNKIAQATVGPMIAAAAFLVKKVIIHSTLRLVDMLTFDKVFKQFTQTFQSELWLTGLRKNLDSILDGAIDWGFGFYMEAGETSIATTDKLVEPRPEIYEEDLFDGIPSASPSPTSAALVSPSTSLGASATDPAVVKPRAMPIPSAPTADADESASINPLRRPGPPPSAPPADDDESPTAPKSHADQIKDQAKKRAEAVRRGEGRGGGVAF